MQDEKSDGQTTEVSESKPQGGRMCVSMRLKPAKLPARDQH